MCLGVIGGTAAVIDRAEAVNAAKAALRDQLKVPLRTCRVRIPVKDGQGGRVVKSLPLVRVILRELQRSDLNLLAAYRKIPILTGRVEARRLHARAHPRRLSQDRARDPRTARGLRRPAADDRQRVQQLPARETHLALVKEHYTNIRANVWFHGLDSRNRGRVMVSAELPLLYPLGRTKAVPEIRYPATRRRGHARPRNPALASSRTSRSFSHSRCIGTGL